MANEHPLARRKRITLREYLRCAHIVVDVSGGGQPAIDRYLQTLATPRKAKLTVPYHAAAPLAVPGTELVATLPERLIPRFASDPTMTVIAAPVEIEVMNYYMCWHPRLEGDPVQRWLRDITRTVAGAL